MNRRVALVDDHAIVRAGLKALVEDVPDYQVVAEGEDGSDVERILNEANPDILLLDISMKHMNGLDALKEWHASFPHVQILVLSMHATPDYVLSALKLGAKGYLLKDAAAAELELALQALSRHESYLSPGISQVVIQSAIASKASLQTGKATELTPRQVEILRLIARGCSTRMVADGLGLSIKTVDTHRAQIMDRLKLHDLPSLVLYAIRTGLISLDD